MATIGKTFSDPDKWENAWFSRLTAGQKLLFVYLWERCDHAGVIEEVLPVWGAHIGQQIDENALLDTIEKANKDKERILRFEGKIWFPEYIRFNQQQDPTLPLSPNYPFHKHVFKRIKHHDLEDEIRKRDPILLKGFDSVTPEGSKNSKASARLSEGLSKPTGKGLGRGESDSKGSPSDTLGKESPIEFEARATGSPIPEHHIGNGLYESMGISPDEAPF